MEDSKTSISGKKKYVDKIKWETVGLPSAIVVLCIVFGIMQPKFFAMENLMNIGRQTAGMSLLAWVGTLIIISGGIDLSSGSVIAFSSVVMTTIVKDVGVVQGILAAIAIGMTFGLFNGIMISKLNLPPFIVTLASMSIGRGAALTYTKGAPILMNLHKE